MLTKYNQKNKNPGKNQNFYAFKPSSGFLQKMNNVASNGKRL
jgi:hypothetical protein